MNVVTGSRERRGEEFVRVLETQAGASLYRIRASMQGSFAAHLDRSGDLEERVRAFYEREISRLIGDGSLLPGFSRLTFVADFDEVADDDPDEVVVGYEAVGRFPAAAPTR